MLEWTKKKWYINDTFQISLGKLVLAIIIGAIQFIGMLCDNSWILTGSMFFSFANALLTVSKQKTEEALTESDLIKLVKGIDELLKEGKSAEDIIESIKNGKE